MSVDDSFDKWATNYRKWATEGSGLMWPSETLVRLIKGEYIPRLGKTFDGRKVIDIGFGHGNNLIFLGSVGLCLHGTEVRDEICQIVRAKLAHLGYEADLRVGTNRRLPFPDNEFDFLVSWNVVHYEDNELAIREAIAEYHRVLKQGGRFFISTTGPKHKILRDSSKIGKHLYRIGRNDDFRKGEVFFYFDTPGEVKRYLRECFSNVLVGRTCDFLMTETLDYFIATGVKE